MGDRGDRDRLSTVRAYEGRVFDVELDRVRFPDGTTGELEIIRHPGASAIVPLVPGGGGPNAAGQPSVVLIRQYRYAAGGFVWEVPAGKLDPGERPEACAARELEEETGMRAGRLEHLGTIYTTPGFTDEVIHLFVGWELVEGEARHEASEFIERHTLPLATALDWVDRGEIRDAKTICALLMAERRLKGRGRPGPTVAPELPSPGGGRGGV